jgi:hypothetical protein
MTHNAPTAEIATDFLCGYRAQMQTPLLTLAGTLLSDTVKKPITSTDLKRLSWFCTTASNYVKGIGTGAAVQQAWMRLPETIQQHAMVIAQEHGLEEWFEALVGQMPEVFEERLNRR